ncbi:MAG TPA: hypothetical protein VED46_08565 [Alphaproteobacteria bacterium]|nr:hypothetical protein [Alphaproteobacteria bacterium]
MASSDIGLPPAEMEGRRSSAVEQAKSEAGRLTQAARERTLSYLEERKSLLAEDMAGVANAARGAAERFDEHGNPLMADYVLHAADGIERFSQAIGNRDLSALMAEAEEFARRQPAVFIGAGVAVGFLLARLLKSSSEHREAARYGYQRDDEYSHGAAAEGAFSRHAYQEGMVSNPGETDSPPGTSQAGGRPGRFSQRPQGAS